MDTFNISAIEFDSKKEALEAITNRESTALDNLAFNPFTIQGLDENVVLQLIIEDIIWQKTKDRYNYNGNYMSFIPKEYNPEINNNKYSVSTRLGVSVNQAHNFRDINEKESLRNWHINDSNKFEIWYMDEGTKNYILNIKNEFGDDAPIDELQLEKAQYLYLFYDAIKEYLTEKEGYTPSQKQIEQELFRYIDERFYYKDKASSDGFWRDSKGSRIRDNKYGIQELILTAGSADKMLPEETNRTILSQYAATFQERNPNLHVLGIYYHADEKTPHIHIDFIPCAHYNRSYDTNKDRWAMEPVLIKALTEQGMEYKEEYKTSIHAKIWKDWEANERTVLGALMNMYHFYDIKLNALDPAHVDTATYRILNSVKTEDLDKAYFSRAIKIDVAERFLTYGGANGNRELFRDIDNQIKIMQIEMAGLRSVYARRDMLKEMYEENAYIDDAWLYAEGERRLKELNVFEIFEKLWNGQLGIEQNWSVLKDENQHLVNKPSEVVKSESQASNRKENTSFYQFMTASGRSAKEIGDMKRDKLYDKERKDR